MKKFVIILNICTFYFCISCDSALDLVPISSTSAEGFYKTETQMDQAVIGCYNAMRNIYVSNGSSFMMTEARSDNSFQGVEYDDGPITRFTETPDLPVIGTRWQILYNGISRCNRILYEIQNFDRTDNIKQYEGEAKFMRALFYFDLVNLFGGVPLITAPITITDSYNVVRASAEAVYDQVVKDLQDAVTLLPAQYPSAQAGRATSWAAKAFLGKTYIFQSGYPLKKNEWSNAKTALNEVMRSGAFEFFDSYANVFDWNYEGGKQTVFGIKFRSGASGHGNPFPTRNAPNMIAKTDFGEGGIPFGGSPGNLFLPADLINSIESGDLRKDVAIRSEWLMNNGQTITNQPFCQKYQNGPVANANDWDIDFIMLRYTDVMMMYAECLNEESYVADGEAFGIMNQVRTRAGLTPKTSADIPDQQSFRLWMEQERRIEFCFENIRWFDLVRTDRAYDVMRAFLTPYGLSDNMTRDRYLYPIPRRVINENPNITQNPGYNNNQYSTINYIMNQTTPLREKVSSRAWLMVALLFVVGALNYLDRMMIATMRESLVSAIPMTDAQFGLLTSVFLWVYGLCSPFAGFIADRFRKSYVIIGSLFVWSGVTWLTGHATTFEQLLFARALMGVSEAFYIPAALAMIVEYHKGSTRSLAVGLHLAGTTVGQSLGFLGGWIAEKSTWNHAFNIFGVIGVLYSAVLICTLRDAPKSANVNQGVNPGEKAPAIRFTDAIKNIFSKKSFIYLLLFWCLIGIVGWLVIGWLPTYYKDHFQLSQSLAGVYATAYLYPASILGLIGGGLWADKWTRTNPYARILVPMIGLDIAAPCIFMASYMNILIVAVVFFMIYAFLKMFVDSNLMPVLCMLIDERYSATGYGILNMLATIVGGIGIYAAGALRDSNINLGIVYQSASLCIVLCVVLLLLIKRNIQKQVCKRS